MNTDFQQEISDLVDKLEEIELKNFTMDLVECVWYEFLESDFEDIDEETIEGYIEETENSLEIINPELKNDIEMMENLLNLLKNYQKIHKND
jgi:hypothetical protein